ncbi:MAG: sigma 54-interacting transcriptional regulator [Planctomycetota bacterium]|jgi:DNA-binding NtrC family response regulator
MILILSQDPALRTFLSSCLRESGYGVHGLADLDDALAWISGKEEEEVRVVFLDVGEAPLGKELPSLEGLRDASPGLPVVLLTSGGEGDADRAQALGATGALGRGEVSGEAVQASMKTIVKLTKTVESAGRVEATAKNLAHSLAYYEEIFRQKYRPEGSSPVFQHLMKEARRLASIPRPVLIQGERGTGKEIVAGAIHFTGPRAKAPFVTVNCAAFHGNLLESEMFGHEKGAFTGADRRKIGRFEMADKGTLFLDEIGNMAPDFQSKILRVIEYQEFERVAGTEKVKVDVRVIAATNADLQEMMKSGDFREDLYDRLAFAVLQVPPLRERPEDVEVLVEAFSNRMAEEVPGLPLRAFSAEVLRKFKSYPWPGNVRQLKNVVERLTCLEGDGPITLSELPPELTEAPKSPDTFTERVDEFQIRILTDALSKTGGSQKKAASLLGLSYDQFRHMVRKFDLLKRLEGEEQG